MTCLVCTTPWDDVARIFQILFDRRHLPFRRLFVSDIPVHSTFALEPGIDAPRMLISEGKECRELLNEDVRAFWYWRSAPCALCDLPLHPSDRRFSKAAFRFFQAGLFHFLEHVLADRGALQINPFSAARRAESKILQILVTRQLGFRVPDTLITNDEEKALEFAGCHPDRTIRKDFLPYAWTEENGSFVNFANRIAPEDIAGCSSFKACPHILQEEIRKEADIRIVVIGDYVFSAEMESRTIDRSIVDWRAHSLKEGDIQTITLPEDLRRRILALRDALGLRTMSMDMARDNQGEYWFLEVNQMGQFLWLDQLLEESFLMEAFFTLLTERHVPADWQPAPGAIHFRELMDCREYHELSRCDHSHPILSYEELIA